MGAARGGNGGQNGHARGGAAAAALKSGEEGTGGLNGEGKRKEEGLKKIGGAVGDFREKVRNGANYGCMGCVGGRERGGVGRG